MSLQLGYLDSNGHPRLRVRVSGTHPTNFIDVEALIDTGFTGFFMLPIAEALPLGLVLQGTADYEIADGSTVTNFLARGKITVPPWTPSAAMTESGLFVVQQESVEGAIVLAGNSPLLGMEFIRELDRLLLVGEIVALIDQRALRPPETPQSSED
jgi:hypothetical protein